MDEDQKSQAEALLREGDSGDLEASVPVDFAKAWPRLLTVEEEELITQYLAERYGIAL